MGHGAKQGTDVGTAKHRLETVAVVLSWFALNIAMASSTKWIFLYGQICVEDMGCKSYKFPVTITVIHMAFSWVVCRVHIFYFRGGLGARALSMQQQVRKVAPLSVCFALSVVMGNLSLKYIYPSFNQMLGAMSPLITVLMAVVLEGKRYNRWTWASMPVICGGLALCSAEEVNFHLLGAFYATGATVLRGLKSLIQAKLLSQGEQLDSVSLLYYMAPWSALVLLMLGVVMEGMQPFVMILSALYVEPGSTPVSGGWTVLFLLVVSGLNACFLNVANFLVTAYTSPITLQVLGNVKSCLAIGVSVAIFRNELKPAQAVGVVVCLFGVWLYNQKGGKADTKAAASAPDTLPRHVEDPAHRVGRSSG